MPNIYSKSTNILALLIVLILMNSCATYQGISYDNDTLSKFADSAFGQTTTPEARLVRAYAIVAAFTAYGARTIEEHKDRGEAKQSVEDAIVLVSQINKAEEKLNKLNHILQKSREAQCGTSHGADTEIQAWGSLLKELPEYTKSYGVYSMRQNILAVAKAAFGPRYQRDKSFFMKMIAGGWGGVLANGEDIIAFLNDAATQEKFKNALLTDIKEHIKNAEKTTAGGYDCTKRSVIDSAQNGALEIMQKLTWVHKGKLEEISKQN